MYGKEKIKGECEHGTEYGVCSPQTRCQASVHQTVTQVGRGEKTVNACLLPNFLFSASPCCLMSLAVFIGAECAKLISLFTFWASFSFQGVLGKCWYHRDQKHGAADKESRVTAGKGHWDRPLFHSEAKQFRPSHPQTQTQTQLLNGKEGQ